MLESYQKSTGTGYTTTVALLAVAFVCSRLHKLLLETSPTGRTPA